MQKNTCFLCQLRRTSPAVNVSAQLTGERAAGSAFYIWITSCPHGARRKIGLEFHHALRLSHLHRREVMIVRERAER
jgi:hypothetical protein